MSIRRSRYLAGVLVAALVSTLIVAVPSAASAGDRSDLAQKAKAAAAARGNGPKAGGGTAVDPRMAAQRPAMDLIRSVQARAESSRLPGYVAAKLEPTNDATIFWHGPVPEAIREHVRQARVAAGTTAGVRFVPVPYSLDQFHAESRRILTAHRELAVSAGPNSSFDGLHVGVVANRFGDARGAIRSSLPLTFMPAEAYTVTSREADTPPYWGGSMIIDDQEESGCSAGWSVTYGGGNSVGMVTADHCYVGNSRWKAGISDRIFGDRQWGHRTTDSMLLSGSTYDPYLYVGPWYSTAKRDVTGWEDAALDQFICDGGAWSGEVCDSVKVIGINKYANTDIGLVGPGFETYKGTLGASAGQGDSGGPAYRLDARNDNRIVILGMITAQHNAHLDTCAGVQGRNCSRFIFHVNANAIHAALGVRARTTTP